jgi:hypothetical protein
MKRQKPALRDDVSQEEKRKKKDEKCFVIPDPIKNPISEFVLLNFLFYTIKLSVFLLKEGSIELIIH